jgi:hypothetical protein
MVKAILYDNWAFEGRRFGKEGKDPEENLEGPSDKVVHVMLVEVELFSSEGRAIITPLMVKEAMS